MDRIIAESILQNNRRLRANLEIFNKVCNDEKFAWSMMKEPCLVLQPSPIVGYRVYWHKLYPIGEGYDYIVDRDPGLLISFYDAIEQDNGKYFIAVSAKP